MDNNNAFLSTLKEKEKELQDQLEALRTTIKMFEKPGLIVGATEAKPLEMGLDNKQIPKSIDEALTWNSKILFALGNIGSGVVQDIVDELRKYLDEDEAVLFKKITGYASTLKKNKVLGAKPYGNKFKYYIK